jgi:prepilin-type N-terminal cleavage/methylation domain-containing protein/prepilin-type processing-associated H-X9-DG protein
MNSNLEPEFRKSKAFTLIELLVVVAIISVLISILVPSLNEARDNAEQVACMSNLRQIGFAFAMYLDDNEGWFPRSVWWYLDFYPTYVTAEESFRCASDPNFAYSYAHLSYGYNYYAGIEYPTVTQPGGIAPPARITKIPRKSLFIVAGDSNNDGYYDSAINLYGSYNGQTPAYRVGERHRGKANILFADWHIEPLYRNQIQLGVETYYWFWFYNHLAPEIE